MLHTMLECRGMHHLSFQKIVGPEAYRFIQVGAERCSNVQEYTVLPKTGEDLRNNVFGYLPRMNEPYGMITKVGVVSFEQELTALFRIPLKFFFEQIFVIHNDQLLRLNAK